MLLDGYEFLFVPHDARRVAVQVVIGDVAGVWHVRVHFGFRSLDSCAVSGFPNAAAQATFTEICCKGLG